MNILDRIVAAKRNELVLEKKERASTSFEKALRDKDCAIIAEVKRRSPSKGTLRENLDAASIASVYERCGAAAISVLTDRRFFGGRKADLVRVRENTSLPVLRKDFIIDPYQVYESKLIGADAVLLIAGILGPALQGLLHLAESLGLHSLVEIHSKEELAPAVDAGARIIGINNRDLRTFQTDIRRSIDLAPLVPPGIVVVSESGIRSKQHILQLKEAGVHAYLVGEAFMKSEDIGAKTEELLCP
jgi:indole-3-glycerol phosphate synthase